MNQLHLTTLPGIPEIRAGDDLAAVIGHALAAAAITLQPNDIIVVAQKVVSKAEDRFVNLDSVVPTAAAIALAKKAQKDPRLVTLILQEAIEISRLRPGLIITRHRLGFISANSGIDRSNVPQPGAGEWVLLLPEDPDRSARHIRQALEERFGIAPGILITDTHGRPHRLGTIGVALGAAGVATLVDRRGSLDREGYIMRATTLGVGDEIAAAASLIMGATDESTPVVHIRGLHLSADGRAGDLYRRPEHDLYL